MEFIKIINLKKLQRKSFFLYAGAGFLSALSLKTVVQSLFIKKATASPKIKVKINPLAISRKKSGSKNV